MIQSSSFPAPPQCLILPSPPPKKEHGYANRCVLEGKQQTFIPNPHSAVRLKFNRQLRVPSSPTLRGRPGPRGAWRASPPPPLPQVPGATQALAKPASYRGGGKGGEEARRAGVVPKLERAAARRRCPRTPVLLGSTRSRAEGTAKGRRRLSRAGRTKARAPNMSKPIPGKLPGVPSEGGGRGGKGSRLQKLSHMPFHSPHLPLLLRGTLSSPQHRCSWPCPGHREAGGGARAAGVTCRESFQLRGAVPHPRARPRGAASSTVRGCLSSGSRRGHCSRSCHSEGCAPARPPASHGPHPGLIGSANPRPCACSRRHLPLARPPGPRLPRPSPPRAAASAGTRWGAARELSAGRGRSASPPHLSGPGLQANLLRLRLGPSGPGLDEW